MNIKAIFFIFCALCATLTSCVTKKEFKRVQSELDLSNAQLGKCGESINDFMKRISACTQEKELLQESLRNAQTTIKTREDQIKDLKDQVADTRGQRDKQLQQVGDLTVLSQSASNNIKTTLQQLEGKDKYIKLLQAAKSHCARDYPRRAYDGGCVDVHCRQRFPLPRCAAVPDIEIR